VSSGEILLAFYPHTHTHTNTPTNFSQPQGLTSLWMTAGLRSQQCHCVLIDSGPTMTFIVVIIFIIIIELYPVGSVVYCLLFLKVAMHIIGVVVSE